MLDYIIVGFGLAGSAIAAHLEKRNKDFIVFDNFSQSSSRVAGGIYNPVILKRFKLAWEADKQLKYAVPFYEALEAKLNAKILQRLTIYRKFHSPEEQNNWFEATDHPRPGPFLNPQLVKSVNPYIPADFSFGRLEKAGIVNTRLFLDTYVDMLKEKQKFSAETFDFEALKSHADGVEYNGLKARAIIFCEGFGVTKNPFFNYLPIRGNKGEYLIIKSEALQLKQAIKSSSFLIPIGNDHYKFGATYDNEDKSQDPTTGAFNFLKKQLDALLDCEYTIVDQEAGIRPSSNDRRPILGRHPRLDNLYLCNGFGSRGVLMAPLLAEQLLNFIEEDIPLQSEVDIKRFQRKHFKE